MPRAPAGFVCIKSPLQRTTAHPSVGTLNLGDGPLRIDWNSLRAAKSMALGAPFASGDVGYAQGW